MTNESISIYNTRSNNISSVKNNNNNSDYIIVNTNNRILNYYIFSKNGICFLEYNFIKIFNDENEYINFKLLLKNISHNFAKKNESNDNFSFNTITISKYKIRFCTKDNIIIVGIFPLLSSNSFQILILLHSYIALINFKENFITKLNNINQNYEYNHDNFDKIENYYNKNENKCLDLSALSEILIYEKYFIRFVLINFITLFSKIFRKSRIKIGSSKLKNLYIMDITTSKILMDLNKTLGNKNNLEYYYKDDLFQEVIYQSQQIYDFFIKNFSPPQVNQFSEFSNRFMKVEFISTYPRLLFIIKFFPLLKGMVIMHIYNQKRLSRNTENNNINDVNYNLKNKSIKKIKECDLFFSTNSDCSYYESKNLLLIDKFLEEYFLTNNQISGFKIKINNKKYKYFNYSMINSVNNIRCEKEKGISYIFETINKKLHDDFLKYKNNKKINKRNNENRKSINLLDKSNSLISSNYISEESIDKILTIKIDMIYKELFKNELISTKNERNCALKIFNEINSTKNMDEDEKDSKIPLSQYKQSINKYNNIKNSRNNPFITSSSFMDNKSNKYINNNKLYLNTKDRNLKFLSNDLSLMNLTNIDFDSKDCEKSIDIIQDNISLISEIKKIENNNLKIVHKNSNKISNINNRNEIRIKKKDNTNMQDLLDNFSNIKSMLQYKRGNRIDESEENRLNLGNEGNSSINSNFENNDRDGIDMLMNKNKKLVIFDKDNRSTNPLN